MAQTSANNSKSFFETIPGILTGTAAILVAITGLYIALHNSSPKAQDSPAETVLADSSSNKPDISEGPSQESNGNNNTTIQTNGDGNITVGNIGTKDTTVLRKLKPKVDLRKKNQH